MTGSGNSNMGNSAMHEAGDQRTSKDSDIKDAERYKHAVPHSHLDTDGKDTMSIQEKARRQQQREKEPDPKEVENEMFRKDPTLPARSHGNEPSKGAKIDAEILAEEEEELRRKGKA